MGVLLPTVAKSQFGLVSPADSSWCVSNTYEFEWDVEENLVSFEIQIGYDSLFNSLEYRRGGLTLDKHEITLDYPDTVYFWRVKAYDVDDNETISEVRTFRTRKAAPGLVYPMNMNKCVSRNHEAVWNDIGADSYEFIVYTDSALTDTLIHKTNLSDTSYTYTLPEYNHTYFWTAKGIFGNCGSDWSDIAEFKSLRAPAVNYLPDDGSTGLPVYMDSVFRVRFQWDHIDTNDIADMFLVQVSDTSDFSRLTYDTLFTADKREILLFFPLDYNKEYFWRVKQEFDGCITEWSEQTDFKIQYAPVQLEMPANGRLCVPIETDFKWQPVEGASAYTVQICDSADFVSDTVYTFTDVDTTGMKFDVKENMTMFYWRVRGDDGDNVGLWSDTYSFMTKQSTPDIIYPADGSAGIDRHLTLKWQDKGEDARYDLMLANDPEFEFVLADTNIAGSEFYFELTEFNQNYYWKLRVAFSDSTYRCNSEWSEVFEFRTQLQAPILLSPADSAVNVPLIPRFEWSDVETAEYYEIAFAYEPEMEFIILYRDSIPNTYAQITSFKFKENTTYYWTVRSSNSEGKSMWSEPHMFTTGIDVPERPMLISPANGAKKMPKEVELLWHSEPRASEYLLEVSTDPFFQNLITDTVLTDTTYLLSGLDNFETYNWRVKSLNDFGESKYTVAWSFRVIDEAPDEAPVLFSPKNNSEDINPELTFTWSEVPKAYGYEIMISTSETFDDGTIVESRRQVWDPVHYVYNLDYGTTYYWRARGWSEAADGPWSDIFNFTTQTDVSVNDGIMSGFDAEINPNPVGETAYLNVLSPEAGEISIEIITLQGNKVLQMNNRIIQKGYNLFNIDATQFASGTYIIKIQNKDKSISGKFIVE